MTYSLYHQAQNLKKRLQQEAFENYRTLLLDLCQDYEHYTWTNDLAGFVKAKDIDSLVHLADSLSEQSYPDATQHFVANQFSALIRKYPFPEGLHTFDPEGNAYRKFMKSEHTCALVNKRFRARRTRIGKPWPYEDHLSKQRNFIRYVIGDEPPLSEVWSKCGFGPGASIGVHGNATSVARKLLATTWTVSPSALHYAHAAIMNHAQFREVLFPEHAGFSSGSPDTDFNRYLRRCTYVKHNKIEFVPKTVKTLRSIAVEPLLNGFVQKGVDEVLRLRLKRIGLDLTDQEPNRSMARLGSFDDEDAFCTIDLSSASDSISIELVRELLPPDWFAFLNALRSKEYVYKNDRKTFSKFVSMGNGFCFPLETLLFAAACHSVGAGRPGIDFRVYGDDIIVRKQFFEPVVSVLRYMGFAVNTDKTFSSGPFRESCGADWFGGEDVRPFTLDFALDSLQALFKFLNLTRRSTRTSGFFAGVRSMILDLIPEKLRLYRPFEGNADTAITSTGDEHLYSPHCKWLKNHYRWRWVELQSRPYPDNNWARSDERGRSAALVFGALSGSASAMPFALRNTSRTKVRFVSHCGSTSSWLPPQRV